MVKSYTKYATYTLQIWFTDSSFWLSYYIAFITRTHRKDYLIWSKKLRNERIPMVNTQLWERNTASKILKSILTSESVIYTCIWSVFHCNAGSPFITVSEHTCLAVYYWYFSWFLIRSGLIHFACIGFAAWPVEGEQLQYWLNGSYFI